MIIKTLVTTYRNNFLASNSTSRRLAKVFQYYFTIPNTCAERKLPAPGLGWARRKCMYTYVCIRLYCNE